LEAWIAAWEEAASAVAIFFKADAKALFCSLELDGSIFMLAGYPLITGIAIA
jgi:hypothetical protein